MGGADVRGVLGRHQLVEQGPDVEQQVPLLGVVGVDAGLDENAAELAADDLLRYVLHAGVVRPEKSVRREHHQDGGRRILLDRLGEFEPGPLGFSTAHRDVVEYEFAGDEDSEGDRAFEDPSELVDDAVLVIHGIAGVGAAEALGLVPAQPAMHLGDEVVDLAVEAFEEFLLRGEDLGFGAFSASAAQARQAEPEPLAVSVGERRNRFVPVSARRPRIVPVLSRSGCSTTGNNGE